MKRSLFFILAVLCMTIAGCEKDGDDDTGGQTGQIILPDVNEQNQTAYADEETTGGFTFTARSAWTATVSEVASVHSAVGVASRATTVPWLRLLLNGAETYSGGAGTFRLIIEIDPNYTGTARSAVITVLSGTDKIMVAVTQEGTNKDGTAPDPGTSSDQSEFIISALNNTAHSDILTIRISETYVSGWPHHENKTTTSWLAYDSGSRKCMEYRQTTDHVTSSITTDHIKYLENGYVYYKQANNIKGAKRYVCGVSPTVFWEKFNYEGLISYLKFYCNLPPREWNDYVWTVNGNEYTAAYVSDRGYIDEEIKITLEANRISRIQLKTSDYTNDKVDGIQHTKEVIFEYTASPALPEGFSTQDFEPAQQYFLRVVWGDGLGETTFYTDYQPASAGYIGSYDYDSSVAAETIVYYTPGQPGKRAEYYADAAFTERMELSKPIYLTDNSLVIYVKWVAME